MNDELRKSLFKKAGALLARRAFSRGELRIRLSKMADNLEIESMLDRLEQLNLLNDADYAYNFALYRIRQEGWGPAKVQESLLRRHVQQAVIECALERVHSELGEESVLIEYINGHCGKKGLPANPKDIRKLIMHLSRRGYDQEAIVRALKRLLPTAAMRRFETGE
jgi:regulatory protein